MTGNQAYSLGFAQVGADVLIYPQAKIAMTEAITIGDSVTIDDFVLLIGGAKTTLGSFIHVGAFTSIGGGGEFVMEDFSGLSGGVRVYTGNEDYSGSCLTNPTVPFPYRVPLRSFVHIHKHAIVGANAIILPGVDIGEGAVVAAGSFIRKDCEPWTVYVGSPARAVSRRPQERILELEGQLRSELYTDEGFYIPKARRLAQASQATAESREAENAKGQ